MAETTRNRKVFTIITAFAIGAFGAVAFATPAAATSVTASTAAELSAAITAANVNPGLDYITLEAGILLTGPLPLITDDLEIEGANFTIDGAVNAVFTVINSADITLRNIHVNNTGMTYGLYLSEGNAVLENANFSDAPAYIAGSGISVTINSSTFNDSGSRQGISLVVDGSSLVTIDNSEASGNRQFGFDVIVSQTSTLSMSGSTALDNSYSGIRAYAETASTLAISDSRADGNSDHGFEVYVDESSGSVTGSTATGNDGNGFSTSAAFSATLTLSDLSSTSNGDAGISLYTEDATTAARGISSTLNNDHSLQTSTVNGGHVIVEDSEFNTSLDGFGADMYVESGGQAQFARVTLSGNALGGIMLEDSSAAGRNSVSFVESTISDNNGSGFTTNDDIENTDVVFDRTTISGNTGSNPSTNGGGGMFIMLQNDSSITVLNSTVSGNVADIVGGIFILNNNVGSQIFISHSTIVNNVSTINGPGGLAILGGQYAVDHTAIAGNRSAGDSWDADTDSNLSGVINYSLVQTPTALALAAMNAGTGNIINTSAGLGPLADNGGNTLTHLPLADSPLGNAGNPAISGAPATDQRGLQRTVGTIDIGAVEGQLALAVTGADAPLLLVGATALLLFSGGVLVMMRRRLART